MKLDKTYIDKISNYYRFGHYYPTEVRKIYELTNYEVASEFVIRIFVKNSYFGEIIKAIDMW